LAQINLLKQGSGPTNFYRTGLKIVARLFLLLLIGLIGYYVWQYIDLKNTDKLLVETQNKSADEKKQALGIPGRDELFVRQEQVKDLTALVGNHLYWSQLLPKLAEVTLKTANYKNLSVSPDGTLTLNATVPSLQDLAKYIEVFDLPQFNKNFSKVQIGGFSRVQSADSADYQFTVHMSFNTDILKYQGK